MAHNLHNPHNLPLADIQDEEEDEIFLTPANPVAAIRYSERPRLVPVTEELPEQLIPLADELARLASQGVGWHHMAGRVGLNAEELRKLCAAYPALTRAVQYGAGVGADEVSRVLYKKATVDEDIKAITLYLQTKAGFSKPVISPSVSVTSGDVTVSIDLDRIRTQAEEQTALLDGIADQ